MSDPVNSPSHYTMGGIEVRDFIDAKELDHERASAIEYIVRAAHKGTEIQDLKKAVWNINHAIEKAEKALVMQPKETESMSFTATINKMPIEFGFDVIKDDSKTGGNKFIKILSETRVPETICAECQKDNDIDEENGQCLVCKSDKRLDTNKFTTKYTIESAIMHCAKCKCHTAVDSKTGICVDCGSVERYDSGDIYTSSLITANELEAIRNLFENIKIVDKPKEVK